MLGEGILIPGPFPFPVGNMFKQKRLLRVAGDGADPAGLLVTAGCWAGWLLALTSASTSASPCCAEEGRDCCRKIWCGLGSFPLPSSATVSAVQAVGDWFLPSSLCHFLLVSSCAKKGLWWGFEGARHSLSDCCTVCLPCAGMYLGGSTGMCRATLWVRALLKHWASKSANAAMGTRRATETVQGQRDGVSATGVILLLWCACCLCIKQETTWLKKS